MTSFARYVVISGLTLLIDLIGFLALYTVLNIPASLLISRIVAGTFAFIAHKIVSFSSNTSIKRSEIFGYAGLVAVNYLLSVAMISAFPTNTIGQASIAKLVAEGVIFVLNFLFLRRIFSATI